jgi:hypothetical protein
MTSPAAQFKTFLPSEAPSWWTRDSWDHQFEKDMATHKDLEQWKAVLKKVNSTILEKEMKKLNNKLKRNKTRKKRLKPSLWRRLFSFKENIRTELDQRRQKELDRRVRFPTIVSALRTRFGEEMVQMAAKLRTDSHVMTDDDFKHPQANRELIIEKIKKYLTSSQLGEQIRAYVRVTLSLSHRGAAREFSPKHLLFERSESVFSEDVLSNSDDGGVFEFVVAVLLSIVAACVYSLCFHLEHEFYQNTLEWLGWDPNTSYWVAFFLTTLDTVNGLT